MRAAWNPAARADVLGANVLAREGRGAQAWPVESHVNFTPNPAPLRPMPRAKDPVRNVFCPSYTACLNTAARRGWQDWTCLQCSNGRQVEAGVRATDFANDRRER